VTPHEARNLKTGDRIRLTSGSRTTGTVDSNSATTLWIRWDSGALTNYSHNSMPHICADPQGGKKKEE